MIDPVLEQGNIDIRKCKWRLHQMYERCVDEIIVAFSPFLDALYHLEEIAPDKGRAEWLKKERRKLIADMTPHSDMLNIIRQTQRKAYPVALAPIREIYRRNFLYIIKLVSEEIQLTADMLLDMWAAGLLNDYDELIEESDSEHPETPEAQAIAAWRESLYEEKNGEQAAENFMNAIPGMKGEIRDKVKYGIRDVVGKAERHIDRFVDNLDSHFTNAGRVEGGEALEEEFGVETKKVWICTFQNSRDSHIAMHLQVRDLDEDFISGLGNVLRFPGDMLAPVEDWINCQCYVVIVPATMVGDDGKLLKEITDYTGKLTDKDLKETLQ